MAGRDHEGSDLPQGDPARASQESPPRDAGSGAASAAAQEASSQEASPPEGSDPGGGAAGASAEAVRLLVRAVGTLPDAERDHVYTWLLGRAMAGPYGAGQWPGRLREGSAQLLSLQQAGGP